MGYAPHHLASQGASPRGEALTKARITLFASLCASTMRQGEATKWLNIFADANEVTPLIFRNLLLKIFRKIENALRPSSVAVRRHLSPQGEGLTKARITLFAEKIKFTEFFSGKGKAWKEENF